MTREIVEAAIERLQDERNQLSCVALFYASRQDLPEGGLEEVPTVKAYKAFTLRNGKPVWWDRNVDFKLAQDRQARIAALQAFKETL